MWALVLIMIYYFRIRTNYDRGGGNGGEGRDGLGFGGGVGVKIWAFNSKLSPTLGTIVLSLKLEWKHYWYSFVWLKK